MTTLPRSFEPEILDDSSVPLAARIQSYRQLHLTHRWLGNTAAVLRLLRGDPLPIHTILDIGCGHGALLHHLHRQLGTHVIGLDLVPAPPHAPVPIVTGNAVTDPLPSADVALSVCMAHHLSEPELIALIRNVSRTSRRLIILDLVRHRLPLFLFQTFVSPFLIPINAQDGTTSLRRAYTPAEFRRIAQAAIHGTSARLTHTIHPLRFRQLIDISWDNQAPLEVPRVA